MAILSIFSVSPIYKSNYLIEGSVEYNNNNNNNNKIYLFRVKLISRRCYFTSCPDVPQRQGNIDVTIKYKYNIYI